LHYVVTHVVTPFLITNSTNPGDNRYLAPTS
jgi:hypothetical protein